MTILIFLNTENISRDTVLLRHNKSKMADGRHFEDRYKSPYLIENRPIFMKFGTRQQY